MAWPVKAEEMTQRARTPGTARSTRRPSPSEMDSAWTSADEDRRGEQHGDEQLLTVAQQGRGLEPGLRQHPRGTGVAGPGRAARRAVGSSGGHATDLPGEREVAVLEPVATGDLGERTLGDHRAGGDDDDVVGQPLGLLEGVRRQDDRGAVVGQRPHQLPDVEPGVRVEAGTRLVEEGHLGPADEGGREGHPLALAPRTAGAPWCSANRRSPGAGRSGRAVPARHTSRRGGAAGAAGRADAGSPPSWSITPTRARCAGAGVPRVGAQDPHLDRRRGAAVPRSTRPSSSCRRRWAQHGGDRTRRACQDAPSRATTPP